MPDPVHETPATAPCLEACCFGADPDGQWARMARVLAWTAGQHCPGWVSHIQRIRPQPMVSALGIASHVANTQKMEHWYTLVSAAPDGARLLLLDADTMITRPLDDVWDRDFDLAYTTKESRFPFNSGVVFVRVTDRARAFVSAWRDENRRMLGDSAHHQTWRKRYGGINQASLGFMLAQPPRAGLTIATLPCVEWNCEDFSWERFDPRVTRIVHLKSSLRRAIFLRTAVGQHVRPLAALWGTLEREALEAERQAVSSPALTGVRRPPLGPPGATSPRLGAK